MQEIEHRKGGTIVKTKFRTLLSLSLAAFMFLSACSSSPQALPLTPGPIRALLSARTQSFRTVVTAPGTPATANQSTAGEIVFASNRFTEKLDIYNSGYSINFFFLEPLFMPDWDCRPK